MVNECKRCLYTSDHALGIVFDEEGICSGCKIHEEKNQIDWKLREKEINDLVKKYRSSKAKYDCIVPVSGAKDSFYILFLVIHILKLKPLVVSYNKYFNTPEGIANLAKLRLSFNVDFQLKNVDPRIVKKITKKSIYAYGNPYWHCLAGETVFPVQTAIMMKIPLIIWGAHQGLEQVGMFSHLDNVEMTRRYRKDHDLFGVEANDMVDPYDDLLEEDMINYRYPSFADIESLGLKGIYLGNYFRWDPYAQHIKMINKYGFKGRNLTRTFDKFDHADCFVYSDLHDLFKFYKHGYSKVTDQVSREIRFGRLNRIQGKNIVSYYENRLPQYIDIFCEWLGTEKNSLLFAANRHRNKNHWIEVEPNKWMRKKNISNIPNKCPAHKKLNYPSKSFNSKEQNKSTYTTIGKGINWPDKTDNDNNISWI